MKTAELKKNTSSGRKPSGAIAESKPRPKLEANRAFGREPSKAKAISKPQPIAKRFPAQEIQVVTFSLDCADARDVKLAGCFNNWQPDRSPMKQADNGEWIIRTHLRSGEYEYRFVVDGLWMEDPSATRRKANPYGGFNSILVVPLAERTSML